MQNFIVVGTKSKQLAGITFDTRRLSRNVSRAKSRNPEPGRRHQAAANK